MENNSLKKVSILDKIRNGINRLIKKSVSKKENKSFGGVAEGTVGGAVEGTARNDFYNRMMYKERELNIDYDALNKKIDEYIYEIEELCEPRFIYEVNKQYALNVKNVDARIRKPIIRDFSTSEIEKIVLGFYKTLNNDMYEQVKDIILGNSDVTMAIYDDKTKEHLPNDVSGLPKYTDNPVAVTDIKSIFLTDKKEEHMFDNGKTRIYIPKEGGIEDIYAMAHEFGHTFDLRSDTVIHNDARRVLAEVMPNIIENLLDDYLLQNNITTQNEINYRRAMQSTNRKMNANTNFITFELSRLKKEYGRLDEQNTLILMNKLGINNNRKIEAICNEVLGRTETIERVTKYLTADLVGAYVYNNYRNAPEETNKQVEEFTKNVKDDKTVEALDSIGLQENIFPTLLNSRNLYLSELEGKIKEQDTERSLD